LPPGTAQGHLSICCIRVLAAQNRPARTFMATIHYMSNSSWYQDQPVRPMQQQ
jgi:hypothetical protein